MTNLRKTQLTLPSEVTDAFTALRERDDAPMRDEYARLLRAEGWTLQSISDAAGITRERVRQVVKAKPVGSAPSLTVNLPLPTPPEKPVKPPREFKEPLPENLKRLLELQLAAQSVRGPSTLNRAEAEEYNAILAHEHLERGVPLYRLSMRLSEDPERYGKASHSALSGRLKRYGILPTVTENRAYKRVLDANRAPAFEVGHVHSEVYDGAETP